MTPTNRLADLQAKHIAAYEAAADAADVADAYATHAAEKSRAFTSAMRLVADGAGAADFRAAASVAGYTELADVLRQLACEADEQVLP